MGEPNATGEGAKTIRIGAAATPRARLSIVRDGALPARAPAGTRARVLASDNYVDHPGYGLTPDRVVSLYRLAELGHTQPQCDLFADVVENDASLRNLIEGRGQAVWGKESSIVADGADLDAELAAEVLGTALADLPFVDAIAHQTEFNPIGWGASEIDWNVIELGGRPWVVPTWFANVEARRFCVEPTTDELRLITAAGYGQGEPLERGKWWVTRRHGARLARAGLMRTATWLALWRRYATRDMVVWLEKWGLPLALVKYDEATEDNAKAVAYEILDNIGNDGGAAVPKAIDVEVVKADTVSGESPHAAMLSWSASELAHLFNGSTEATNSGGGKEGGGSYAQARVHAAIRWEAVLGDAERIQDSFRRCVAVPFMRYNGLAGRAPQLEIQVVRDQAPSDLLSAAVLLEQQLGIKVSQSQLRRIIGLRAPVGTGDAAPGPTVPGGAAPPGPKGDK
jgi:phage gp29-like protein